MKNAYLAAFLLFSITSLIAEARSYVPFGSLQGSAGLSQGQFLQVKTEDRPYLPGMRPAELELLEDALRRKMPRTIGTNRTKAYDSIVRNSMRDPVKRSHMRGILAEALYLDRNPTWGYVKSPNASQHDLYTWLEGRRSPYTAQIKTHASGNPVTYAQDMISDHRANRFVIPDDHVQPLREYWRNRISKYEAVGQKAQIIEAQRQYARISGLGSSSKELDGSLSKASKYVLRERQATYVSLGAAVAMAVGPGLLNWFQTGSVTDQTIMQATHAGGVIATERATTFALGRYGTGALRGGFRGNTITGVMILVADTSLFMYEQGGTRAFQNVGFLAQLGGSISGLALGLSSGTIVASAISPYSPLLGATTGFVAGSVMGLLGYYGGEITTRNILEITNPEFFHIAEDTAIDIAQKNIDNRIALIQKGAS